MLLEEFVNSWVALILCESYILVEFCPHQMYNCFAVVCIAIKWHFPWPEIVKCLWEHSQAHKRITIDRCAHILEIAVQNTWRKHALNGVPLLWCVDQMSQLIVQLLCVWEIPGVGLSPETGCPGRYCLSFSSLPPENCWNSSSKKVTSGVLHVL